ncbi:MAG: poly-beta-1,6-N-acetyl-D-glucosamine synthase [Gammaproteobacteria bacterium]|nr:poly-beta-1,6-N-acetyl-D-glucosamine synthase [Gammaproteobacteria bacterium]
MENGILYFIIVGLLFYAFYYPLLMSYVWMIGALYYFFRWEWHKDNLRIPKPLLANFPSVSFVVPCYNEEEDVEQTITSIAKQDYPNFEIVAVNDGSSDKTGEILDDLTAVYPQLRVVHFDANQGKAVALRSGSLMAQYEYIVCLDGDSLLDPDATRWIMRHFIYDGRVGAVTGNPRIRTRSSLLGKIQVGEFSAIIGMIKRAQRIYGRMFTVSGVIAAFRRAALQDVGYWSLDTVTEDIDVSWKLQLNHWDVRFEPNALCWVLMPETLSGLWKQRLRWAQGGMEALLKYYPVLKHWKKRRMWPIYGEFFASVLWAYVMFAMVLLSILNQFIELPPPFDYTMPFIGWAGIMLCITNMLQFAVSLMIDSRHERGNGRYYYWMIWYPMAYWILYVLTTVVAVPKALMRTRGLRARWESPDRGLRP